MNPPNTAFFSQNPQAATSFGGLQTGGGFLPTAMQALFAAVGQQNELQSNMNFSMSDPTTQMLVKKVMQALTGDARGDPGSMMESMMSMGVGALVHSGAFGGSSADLLQASRNLSASGIQVHRPGGSVFNRTQGLYTEFMAQDTADAMRRHFFDAEGMEIIGRTSGTGMSGVTGLMQHAARNQLFSGRSAFHETTIDSIDKAKHYAEQMRGIGRHGLAAELEEFTKPAAAGQTKAQSMSVLLPDVGYEHDMKKYIEDSNRALAAIGDITGSKDVRELVSSLESASGMRLDSKNGEELRKRVESIRSRIEAQGLPLAETFAAMESIQDHVAGQLGGGAFGRLVGGVVGRSTAGTTIPGARITQVGNPSFNPDITANVDAYDKGMILKENAEAISLLGYLASPAADHVGESEKERLRQLAHGKMTASTPQADAAAQRLMQEETLRTLGVSTSTIRTTHGDDALASYASSHAPTVKGMEDAVSRAPTNRITENVLGRALSGAGYNEQEVGMATELARRVAATDIDALRGDVGKAFQNDAGLGDYVSPALRSQLEQMDPERRSRLLAELGMKLRDPANSNVLPDRVRNQVTTAGMDRENVLGDQRIAQSGMRDLLFGLTGNLQLTPDMTQRLSELSGVKKTDANFGTVNAAMEQSWNTIHRRLGERYDMSSMARDDETEQEKVLQDMERKSAALIATNASDIMARAASDPTVYDTLTGQLASQLGLPEKDTAPGASRGSGGSGASTTQNVNLQGTLALRAGDGVVINIESAR